MIRTAIYMRVSSDKQAQEGDSIPAQRTALRKYIDDHADMILSGEYLDDGISGTKEDRDELQRMLSDVKEGKIDKILVTKLDRLYRSIRHYLNLQDTLDKCGVSWVAIWEPIYDTSTPQGRLIINQMMSIAQFEAENTGQRIRQVQAYKVIKGEVLSGNTPAGYKIESKHLVPDETAPAVLDAFKTFAYTGSINQTMRLTQGKGLPITKSSFKQMLKNAKYIGSFRGNDKYCTPIVPKDLFDEVQRKLSMNVKANQRHTYIFSGLLKCGECGCSMGANCRKRTRGNSTSYTKQYRCPAHYQGGVSRCNNAKVVSEHALEVYLIDNIRSQIADLKLTYEVKLSAPADNTKQIAALKKKLSRLKELYINELITIEEYKTDKEQIEVDIQTLEAATPSETPDFDALDAFLNMGIENIYWNLTDEEKRYLWRSVIKEIRMGIDRKCNIIFL